MRYAVRQIITEGVDPLIAIQMATINPARCYGLDHQIGVIAPGRSADLLFVNDLRLFDVSRVMVDGRFLEPPLHFPRHPYPQHALATVNLTPVTANDLLVRAPEGQVDGDVAVRVIGVHDGALVTEEIIARLPVRAGIVSGDPQQDILKAAVFDRYGKGTRTVAFVRGFGLRDGAFAGSIGQDSQNVVGVGACDADLACAINEVIRMNGGVAVVRGDSERTTLPLPIAGIMTDASPAELAQRRAAIATALWSLGCALADPIFALSLAITLVVIPALKMSNRGLVDVMRGAIVPLFAEQ